MNKVVSRALCCTLALACLLSLMGAWGTVDDFVSAKAHWEEVGNEGKASFAQMMDGIEQLKANRQTYLDGAATYLAGLEEYEAGVKSAKEGAQKIADNEVLFAENEVKLAQGHKDYDAGVLELEKGKADLADGALELANGEAELAAGKQEYLAGQITYQEGLEAYAEGEKTLRDGEAELAARKSEYEQGKLKLALVTPIYLVARGILNDIEKTKDNFDAAVAAGDQKKIDRYQAELDRLYKLLDVELAGYTIEGITAEYEQGKAQIALYEESEAKVEAGRKQLANAKIVLEQGRAQLEAAEVQLAEGEKKLAEGRAEYAEGQEKVSAGEAKLTESKKTLDEKDIQIAEAAEKLKKGKEDLEAGKQKLVDGEKSLADGKAQLKQYEDGEKQLADGLDQAIGNETYFDAAGDKLLPSIADRLGSGFNYWELDGKGGVRVVNENDFLDLDKALDVHDAGIEFMANVEENVTAELTVRILSTVIAAIAAIIGLTAAAMAFFGKYRPAKVLSIICAAIAAAALVYNVVNGTEQPYSAIAGAKTAIPMVLVLGSLAVAAIANIFGIAVAKREELA